MDTYSILTHYSNVNRSVQKQTSNLNIHSAPYNSNIYSDQQTPILKLFASYKNVPNVLGQLTNNLLQRAQGVRNHSLVDFYLPFSV